MYSVDINKYNLTNWIRRMVNDGEITNEERRLVMTDQWVRDRGGYSGWYQVLVCTTRLTTTIVPKIMRMVIKRMLGKDYADPSVYNDMLDYCEGSIKTVEEYTVVHSGNTLWR